MFRVQLLRGKVGRQLKPCFLSQPETRGVNVAHLNLSTPCKCQWETRGVNVFCYPQYVLVIMAVNMKVTNSSQRGGNVVNWSCFTFHNLESRLQSRVYLNFQKVFSLECSLGKLGRRIGASLSRLYRLQSVIWREQCVRGKVWGRIGASLSASLECRGLHSARHCIVLDTAQCQTPLHSARHRVAVQDTTGHMSA